MKKRMAIMAAISGLMFLSVLGVAQTADEIIDQMENVFQVNVDDERGVLATMVLENEYAGGVSSEYTLAVFELTEFETTRPEDADETSHVLMYFLGGDEDGSIFLLKTPEDETLDSQMWLYLPALGVTKELVSDTDQAGSFAGSSMSYGDLGGTSDLRDDYTATILREETMDVDGESFDVWVLDLSAKPDANPDYDRVLLWVSKEDYLSLRMESYNSSDALESTMEFLVLGEFEGDRVPEVIQTANLEDGTSTTVTVSGMRRPDAPLTLELFDPTSLGELDPSAYGF